MSRLIYNSSHRVVDSFMVENVPYTFLDNACKEVPNEVATLAIQEFPWLKDITPSNTVDVIASIAEVKESINQLQEERKGLDLIACEKCGKQCKVGTGIGVHKKKCYAQETPKE